MSEVSSFQCGVVELLVLMLICGKSTPFDRVSGTKKTYIKRAEHDAAGARRRHSLSLKTRSTSETPGS